MHPRFGPEPQEVLGIEFRLHRLICPREVLLKLADRIAPALDVRMDVVFTNTTAKSPVRGAGRPNTAFAMERAIEAIVVSATSRTY